MPRPGTQKRSSPRKSVLAKAALRTSSARAPAQGSKPASKAELADARANRPKVDFLDPFMRHAAMQAKGISLCAFLVTLAAFQRGLKVTFHYERASSDPRFAKAKMQGHRGELFSISNGTRTHTFSRTLGDLTDPAANAIAEDKHLTKAALKRAGVRTPEGIVVDKSQTALVEKFLAQHPGKRFVVKPHDGSMGRDVHADLTAIQVIDAVQLIGKGRVLIEEHVSGYEVRALVCDGACISITGRIMPNVRGDGKSTIEELIALKNSVRKNNPHLCSRPVREFDEITKYLSGLSLGLKSIPEVDKEVTLSPVANFSRGADSIDLTGELIENVGAEAVKAALALGIGLAGVDLIVNANEKSQTAFVIELNQRPHIGSHSFPMEGLGQGNSVAEAIVDYYFPETASEKNHPTLAYDFAPILAALESAQISEVSLPVIGPDWQVLRFVETGIAAKAMVKLIETAARTAGVFVMSAPRPKGGVELCFAYGPNNWRAFLNVIPAQFRARLEKLAA